VSASELHEFVAEYRQSVDAFITGDPEPQKPLWSRRDDVTLANPLGPAARGWREVEAAMDRAAAQIRDGEPGRYETISEYATADLAYNHEIQHTRAKLGGGDDIRSISLRVTTIFRREHDGWRIVHRHADAITEPRPAESAARE
jgi:ketosteroid isomerase-like protein